MTLFGKILVVVTPLAIHKTRFIDSSLDCSGSVEDIAYGMHSSIKV
jgi:hypothetical protein